MSTQLSQLSQLSQLTINAIIKDMPTGVKEMVYASLHEELHNGITKMRDPDYVIFRFRYTYRLQNYDTVLWIHAHLRDAHSIEDVTLQILTLSLENHQYYAQSYYAGAKIVENPVFIEHPETAAIVAALKAKVELMQSRGGTTAAYYGHYVDDVCLVKILEPEPFSIISAFEDAINTHGHCGGLGSSPYRIEEFEITVNGEPKIVQYRAYDTESG